MPFTKTQPEDLSKLRDPTYEWGKIGTRRAFCQATLKLTPSRRVCASFAVGGR